MKYLLVISVLIAIAAHASALKCYSCDYMNDNDCKGEDADLGALSRSIDPDEDEFEYCYKVSFDSDKRGVRGTLDKDGLDFIEDTFDVKNNECDNNQDYAHDGDTYDDAQVCVCDTDWCNGSGTLAVSMTTLLLAAIAKYFC